MPDQLIGKTNLFTPRTLFALGGASTGVWLFTTVLAAVFGVDIEKYKWIGLLVALSLAFIGAFPVKNVSLKQLTVAFFNGLLIYVTAVGINSINQGARATVQETAKSVILPLSIDKPWWPPTTMVDSLSRLKTQYAKILTEKKALAEENLRLSELNKKIASESQELRTGNSLVIKGNEEQALKACLAERNKLRSELEKAQKQLASLNPTTAEISSPLNNTETLSRTLNNLKLLNANLLKSLNTYLDAGSLEPRTQAAAYQRANEKANELRNDLVDYNDKVDLLLRTMPK